MKRTIIIAALLLSMQPNIYAQAKSSTHTKKAIKKEEKLPLSKAVIKDFAVHAEYEYKYGNGNFTAAVFQHFARSGYSISDVAVKMENLENNFSDLKQVLDVFMERGGDKDFVFMNISSIGVSATTAKTITDYLFNKQ